VRGGQIGCRIVVGGRCQQDMAEKMLPVFAFFVTCPGVAGNASRLLRVAVGIGNACSTWRDSWLQARIMTSAVVAVIPDCRLRHEGSRQVIQGWIFVVVLGVLFVEMTQCAVSSSGHEMKTDLDHQHYPSGGGIT